MTGPENYREAERLIRHSQQQEPPFAAVTLQQAQVHATLALAAAVAISRTGDMPVRDGDGWDAAAGTRPHREDLDEQEATS